MVRRLVRVLDLEVKNAIDFDLHVISSYCTLLIDRQHLLLQRVVVRDSLQYRQLEVEARLQDAGEFAKTFDHVHVPLRYQDEGV